MKITQIIFSSIKSGTTLITEGETSDVFYFYTSPTLPPADLACETTYDSLILTWSQPTLGMEENTTYYYSYNLIKSMPICFFNNNFFRRERIDSLIGFLDFGYTYICGSVKNEK